MISKHGVYGDVAYRAAHLMKTVHYDMFNDLFKLNRINRAGGVCLEYTNNLTYDECLKGCGSFERLRNETSLLGL